MRRAHRPWTYLARFRPSPRVVRNYGMLYIQDDWRRGRDLRFSAELVLGGFDVGVHGRLEKRAGRVGVGRPSVVGVCHG